MSDERSQADADLEREIREGRKFTLAEAIGRMVGPGAMKGVSPVGSMQQAEVAIEHWLSCNLLDSAGALRTVLTRRIKGCELLLEDHDQPLLVLTRYCQSMLDNDFGLLELVREIDVEWGRIVGERPHFDKEDAPPHPDDAYTVESVRKSLNQVIRMLSQGSCRSSL